MMPKIQHLIDLNDYPTEWWNKIIELGLDIKDHPQRYIKACSGKIMATLFFEPSTRTQMSFQTAMIRLGGSIIGFDNPASSSVSKGENLKDTTKIVSNYADIIIMRHTQEGAVKAAALSADCPVINAGDGGHLHPTQTLTDLITLMEEKKTLGGHTIGLCGDLLNGRTVHSLCKALSCYHGNKFILISTKELRLPSYIKEILKNKGCEYTEVRTLEEAIGELDVLYMTRIQRERFLNEAEYFKQKNTYVLDCEKMKRAKKELLVMHPLPRVDEIAVEVDDDTRAAYFRQAAYGVYARMALIMTILDNREPVDLLRGSIHEGHYCRNPRCITNTELYLPKSFIKKNDTLICEYCDAKVENEQ